MSSFASTPASPSPSAAPRRRWTRGAVVGCAGVLLGVTGCQGPTTPETGSATGLRSIADTHHSGHAVTSRGRTTDPPGRPDGRSAGTDPATGTDAATTAGRYADGHLPDGVDVFDESYPAVSRLDPDLRQALRRAARQAEQDGVRLVVNSGWRSEGYQEQLLREARARYGDGADTGRWVATPATSAHVRGQAVDIGGTRATAWLARHGAASALCQTYANEPWHFELRPDAPEHGCPDMYADASHDPRTQQ